MDINNHLKITPIYNKNGFLTWCPSTLQPHSGRYICYHIYLYIRKTMFRISGEPVFMAGHAMLFYLALQTVEGIVMSPFAKQQFYIVKLQQQVHFRPGVSLINQGDINVCSQGGGAERHCNWQNGCLRIVILLCDPHSLLCTPLQG